jgi:hypothetical protein
MDNGDAQRRTSRHDVINILGSTGAQRKLLRSHVNGKPYILRNCVQRILTTASEKRFRAAAAKAAAEEASEEDEVSHRFRASAALIFFFR